MSDNWFPASWGCLDKISLWGLFTEIISETVRHYFSSVLTVLLFHPNPQLTGINPTGDIWCVKGLKDLLVYCYYAIYIIVVNSAECLDIILHGRHSHMIRGVEFQGAHLCQTCHSTVRPILPYPSGTHE